MSASLVGSEMCIRDSSLAALLVLVAPLLLRLVRFRTGLAGVVCGKAHPVSYTHLTLPTICSV
eukprot:2449959-Alexandrium_andersonii.AAC.1